jgi:hypothetical protein
MRVFSQSVTKEQFPRFSKRMFLALNAVTLPAVAHSRTVQLSAAVRLWCGAAGWIEGRPEGGPATDG